MYLFVHIPFFVMYGNEFFFPSLWLRPRSIWRSRNTCKRLNLGNGLEVMRGEFSHENCSCAIIFLSRNNGMLSPEFFVLLYHERVKPKYYHFGESCVPSIYTPQYTYLSKKIEVQKLLSLNDYLKLRANWNVGKRFLCSFMSHTIDLVSQFLRYWGLRKA